MSLTSKVAVTLALAAALCQCLRWVGGGGAVTPHCSLGKCVFHQGCLLIPSSQEVQQRKDLIMIPVAKTDTAGSLSEDKSPL